MAKRDADHLTPSPTAWPVTIAQELCHHMTQSGSDRPRSDVSERRSDSVPARQTVSNTLTDRTPVMTDEDVHRTFRTVEQELERLRTTHITHRKFSKPDAELSHASRVPLPDSDSSKSQSPVSHSSPASVMRKARDSGQFSTADLQLFQDAFNTAVSISTPHLQLSQPVSHASYGDRKSVV